MVSNGMGGKSVTNPGGEQTNTQHANKQTQAETTFRDENFSAEGFLGKKAFYYFGMSDKSGKQKINRYYKAHLMIAMRKSWT